MHYTVYMYAEASGQVAVLPSYIAYRSAILENTITDSCTQYPSTTAPVPQGVDPTQYVQCSQPTTITDTMTNPPFYVLAEGPGQILFVFSSPINLTSISIHYQFNATYALAKLRLYAVPGDFEAWSTIDTQFSGFSEPIDEVLFSVDQESGLRSVTRTNLQWETSRVLLRKLEDTKTYLFAISEVMFQAYLPPTTGKHQCL